MDGEDARTIGERARTIRRRRGLSLEVVGGLAGISGPYLSMLERGQRGFNRRGLIEDLADALGCSGADLTGQPYLAVDRQSAVVIAAVTEISTALHDVTLEDVPDISARPMAQLTSAAALAHACADDAGHGLAGQGRAALTALVEACKVAYILAKRTGCIELAGIAAQRGLDAARRAERPDLAALMEMNRASTLIGVGAHRRGRLVCAEALRDISALPGPTEHDTTTAEACGMLHLTTALIAARDGRTGDVATHLAEVRALAAHTGERNHLRYHFGPNQCGRLGAGPGGGGRYWAGGGPRQDPPRERGGRLLGRPGREDPGACPVSVPHPWGVLHLLVADDALPGGLGAHAVGARGRPMDRRGPAGRPRVGSPPGSVAMTWGLSAPGPHDDPQVRSGRWPVAP
jgi:transcriptional regulator with XRE-family HTH domain